jgi:hypothetical protein
MKTIKKKPIHYHPVKTTKKKPLHYVNNKQMYADIVEYQRRHKECVAAGQEPPQIPDSIGRAFFQIATRRASAPDFSLYWFKDEMIADGYTDCVLRIMSFNPEVTQNPFAYYTTVIYYAFIRRIKAEKRFTLTKIGLEKQANILDDLTESSENQ